MAVSGRVDFKGPFFEKDPRKTFRANIRDLMQAVADEGARDVIGQLRKGEASRYPLGGGIKPGRVSAHVLGRTKSLTGKPWEVTAVVSVNTRGMSAKQAIKVQAAGSWLESQGHAFRRTAGAIRRSRKVVQADLLKGLQ